VAAPFCVLIQPSGCHIRHSRPEAAHLAFRSIGVVPEMVSMSAIPNNTMTNVMIEAGDGSDAS
jgi:hypothetical protein